MKKNLLAAAAAVALLGSAVAANAQTIGHVGANYSRAEFDLAGLGEADVDVWQLEGAVRFDAGALGGQIDGSVTDGEGIDTSFAGTGHLNTDLGGALVGGFAGVDISDDVTFWGLGVEAQANLAPSTLVYGQFGYGASEDFDDADFWAGRAEVRHFFADNIKLQGSAGFLSAETDAGDFDGWNAGVEAEYQFTGTPFSVLAAYDHLDSDDLGVDGDTFRVGVRYTFGGSIRERDQAGAGLGSISRLFGAGLVR